MLSTTMITRAWLPGLVCLAMAFGAGAQDNAAAADDGEASPRVLDRMVITGTAGAIEEIPGSAHALDAEDLDRHSYSDIHRVLREIPGVNILEEDGFGLFPNIGLRGTRLERNTRITVMEDGVLIAPAPYSAPAAYYFPQTARMSGVEVRKGSSAIQYGPYTTGGAINMLSTPIPDRASARADLMMGGHDGRRTHVWAGDSSGQWGWLIEGHGASSTGFKRLDQVTDGAQSRPNAPRPDTGFDTQNVVGKLRWNATDGPVYQDVELKLGFDDRTANETYLGLTRADFDDQPFRRYRGSQLDQINTDHQQYQLRHYIEPAASVDVTTTVYRHDFARNWYKLHAVQNAPGGGFEGISSILDDPASFADAMDWIRGAGGTDLLGNVRANNREYYAHGAQTQIGYFFNTGAVAHELEVGLRYHVDEEDRFQWEDSFRMDNGAMILVRPGDEQGAEGNARSGIPGTTTNRVTDARALAVSVQDTMRFGRWTLTPGLRFENIKTERTDFDTGTPRPRTVTGEQSDTTTVWLPGLGATYQLTPAVRVLAGVHRGFAPTGADPDVPAEKSWNFEAGARYRAGLWQAEAIGFFTRYENLVGVCTASSGGGCTIGDQFDGGRVNVMGLETSAAYDLGRAAGLAVGVPVRLAWTWTDSEFRNAFNSDFAEWGVVEKGDELPQIPEHQLNLGIGVVSDAWQANLNASYVAETRAVAGSGAIPDAEKIDSRLLFDVSGEYRVHSNARLFASVENLLDEAYLAARRPAGTRPGMPRTGWVGVKLDF